MKYLPIISVILSFFLFVSCGSEEDFPIRFNYDSLQFTEQQLYKIENNQLNEIPIQGTFEFVEQWPSGELEVVDQEVLSSYFFEFLNENEIIMRSLFERENGEDIGIRDSLFTYVIDSDILTLTDFEFPVRIKDEEIIIELDTYFCSGGSFDFTMENRIQLNNITNEERVQSFLIGTEHLFPDSIMFGTTKLVFKKI